MPYTAADLQKVQAAKAGGARMVRFADGRTIEHFTMAELSLVEAEIKAELAAGSTTPIVRQIRIYTKKGF